MSQLDQYGAPKIGFELTDKAPRCSATTRRHVDDILAIVLDNVVLSAPAIQQRDPRRARA